MRTLSAIKQQQFLIFTSEEEQEQELYFDLADSKFKRLLRSQELYFDLADSKFKRLLRSGVYKEVVDSGVAKFFRKVSPDDVGQAFKDRVYSVIIKRVVDNERRRENANFATIFSKVNKYMHLESYLLLGINLSYEAIPFRNPVSHFNKPVIRFMRESGFAFGRSWEEAYDKNTKLVTDLCTYVLEKHHDDLLIYKHLFDIVSHRNNFNKFICLTLPIDVIQQDDYYYGSVKEHGFGAEYKSLFDFVIRCIAVEAMRPNDVIEEYYDYLRMARKIKQLKHLARLRESGDTTTRMQDIEFVDYRKIEKYPSGLTIRHRIVTRNYGVMQQQYDLDKFSSMVNHDFAWSSDDYCIVTAKTPDDIKNEGTELNHCVGSYIDAVVQGRTQIVFMRKADFPEQSLVTVEIRSRSIQQARGYSNRELSDTEIEFLKKYAEAKNLTYKSIKSDDNLPCPIPNAKKAAEPMMVA
jgi:hypothetical protein